MKKILSYMLSIFMIIFTLNLTTIKAKAEGVSRRKMEPILNVESGSMPEVKAGDDINISLVISNNSSYQAKDIKVIPILAQGDMILPFTFNTLKPDINIDRIYPRQSANITLDFKVNDNAQARIYPLKLKYSYKNNIGDMFESEELIYIKVTSEKAPSKIAITRILSSNSFIKPGEFNQLLIDIKNVGDIETKDIKISLIDLKDSGFSLKDSTNTQFIDMLNDGGSALIKYNLKADDNATPGSHPIKLKLEYSADNKPVVEEQQVFLWVNSEKGEGNSNLLISEVTSPKEGVMPNGTFDISFALENIGEASAKNINVSVDGKDLIAAVSQNLQMVPELSSKDKKVFNFTMQATEAAAGKNSPITIEVQFDGKNGVQKIKQYVGVYVQKKDDPSVGSKGVPKIIINRYESKPGIAKAGENFDLTVSFLNTNSDKDVKNVKVYLTVTEANNEQGSVFTPVNSSNTFYIDVISPKSSVERKLTMYTIPAAKPKTYTITANFEYEDSEGKEYKATELIGIPVAQPSKISTSELVFPTEGGTFAGMPIPLNLEIYNMGKVAVSNLMVKVQGNFEVRNANKFIGNFEIGATEGYETEIIAKAEGDTKGVMLISFDEPNGEHKEVKKEFSIKVTAAPPPPNMPEDMMNNKNNKNNKQKSKKKIIIYSSIGIVGIGIITGIVIRKKKIKKKGMTLDE